MTDVEKVLTEKILAQARLIGVLNLTLANAAALLREANQGGFEFERPEDVADLLKVLDVMKNHYTKGVKHGND
jgi:hypothetical protein